MLEAYGEVGELKNIDSDLQNIATCFHNVQYIGKKTIVLRMGSKVGEFGETNLCQTKLMG